jgi:hypothetical protein
MSPKPGELRSHTFVPSFFLTPLELWLWFPADFAILNQQELLTSP